MRALFAFALASLPACADPAAAGPAPTAPATTTEVSTSAEVLPASLFASSAPTSAVPVANAPVEPAPCPAGMAHVGKFCVDKYEAHLVVRGDDGALTKHKHSSQPPAGAYFEARSEAGAYPQAYISRVDSAAACKNAGKRLCTMAEWRRACKGPRGHTYPYGASFKEGACPVGKAHLLTRFYGPDARRWKYEQFNDPKLDEEPGFLAKSGEYERCASPEGVHDLVGNLHEWVSDPVNEAFVTRFENEGVDRHDQPHAMGNGVFVGGFFSTKSELGPGCAFTTIAHEPRYHDYSTGFRCCADVKTAKPAKP